MTSVPHPLADEAWDDAEQQKLHRQREHQIEHRRSAPRLRDRRDKAEAREIGEPIPGEGPVVEVQHAASVGT
jgi:hypothetical protein